MKPVLTGLENLSKKFDAFDQRIAALEKKFERIDEKIVALERAVYRDPSAKAAALGFVNPSIVNTPLKIGSSTFAEQKRPIPYRLQYRIKEIDSDKITLLMNGFVGGFRFEENLITFPLKPGEIVDINRYIQIPGMPRIFLTVLAVPKKEELILAIGPNSVAEGKT